MGHHLTCGVRYVEGGVNELEGFLGRWGSEICIAGLEKGAVVYRVWCGCCLLGREKFGEKAGYMRLRNFDGHVRYKVSTKERISL